MQEAIDKLNKILEKKKQLTEDSVLINDKAVPIEKEKFVLIVPNGLNKVLAFVDGGNAELFNSEDTCLQFVRVAAVFFQNNKRLNKERKVSFFLLSQINEENPEEYLSQFFWEEGSLPLKEFSLNALDFSLREGVERGEIKKEGEIVRRKAELLLAKEVCSEADWVVLDGPLEEKLPEEKEILDNLPANVCALAKSCSLITSKGRSATSRVSLVGPKNSRWSYFLDQERKRKTFFVRLNEKSNHVFRFETFSDNDEIFEALAANSTDPVFTGYPYGLIYADQRARVSNQEAALLKTKLFSLIKKVNTGSDLTKLNNSAHDVLDCIRF